MIRDIMCPSLVYRDRALVLSRNQRLTSFTSSVQVGSYCHVLARSSGVEDIQLLVVKPLVCMS